MWRKPGASLYQQRAWLLSETYLSTSQSKSLPNANFQFFSYRDLTMWLQSKGELMSPVS